MLPPIPNCCKKCGEPVTTTIPGPQGNPGDNGTNGSDGQDAFTATTAEFTMPEAGVEVQVGVIGSAWAAIGAYVFVEFAGTFQVTSRPSSVFVGLTWSDKYHHNAAPGTSIPASSLVTPTGGKGDTGDIDTGGALIAANNLSDLADSAAARTNLGLGTMSVEVATNYLAKSGNLAGLVSAITARANLGLAIGSQVQAFSSLLLTIASQTTAADRLIFFTGLNAASVTTLTSLARTLLANTTALAMRSTLGGVLTKNGLLGSSLAVDLNSATTDYPIAVESGRYIIDMVLVVNASLSLTTATLGVFTAAGGGGTAIVNDSGLTALTAPSKFEEMSLNGIAGTDTFTSGTLYARVGTPQGAAATADIYIFGRKLD